MNVKRALALLLAMLMCATLFAACGDKAAADSFSLHPDADGHGPEEAASQATGASTAGEGANSNPGGADAPQDGASSAPEVLNSVTGIIDGAGMGDFYVMLEDGMVLQFPHEDADISGLEDTLPGSPITVWFTGELDGNDTSGVTVVRMETPDV